MGGTHPARRLPGLVWVVADACLSPLGVQAARPARPPEPVIEFHVPAKPLGEALVAFALQAKISISLKDVGACSGTSRPLDGRFTPRAGLTRLLGGSGCGFREIDPSAFDLTRPTTPPRPSATPAAPAEPSAQAPISEFVVVASHHRRRSESLEAYDTSATTQQSLSRQGLHDLGDVAMVTPTMTVTNLGMGRDKVLLRGLSDGPLTGRTQAIVGLFLDDTRLTFNAPDPDLRLVDMDAVEVLRGPQGALYGPATLGGVVRLATAPPDADRFGATVAGSYGLMSHGGPSNSVDGVVNLPFAHGRGAARLVVYDEHEGGYIYNAVLNLNNVNRSDRTGGRLAVLYDLTPRWTLSAGVVIQEIHNADTQYANVGAAAYTRLDRLREPSKNDFDAYHIDLKGDLGWADLRTAVGYIRHDNTERYDASSGSPVSVPRGPVAYDEHDRFKTITGEATLTSARAGRLQWLGGVFYAHTDESTATSLTVETVPSTFEYTEERRDHLDEGAVFGEATLSLMKHGGITLGGRVFTSRDTINSLTTSAVTPDGAPYAATVSQTGFAPKLVIFDRPAQGLLVYAQITEGYRGPGVNTAQFPGENLHLPGQNEPLQVYKGDQMWSAEAGAKLSAMGDRLTLGLAGFFVEWRDIQSDQLLPSGLPYTANVGNGRNIGVELEGAWRSGGFEIRGSLLLNNPDLTQPNPYYSILANSGLGVVPDVGFGLSTRYAWKLPRDLTFELDGRASYVGNSNLLLNIAALPKMGDYVTSRLAASLAGHGWRMTLSVDNPADVQGNTFAYGDPFTLRRLGQITPLRPRTITLAGQVSY